MSTDVLEDLLRNIDIGTKYFRGIFAYDAIPNHLWRNKCFVIIVNIGLHFVTLYVEPDHLVYIDSFGAPAPIHVKNNIYANCGRAHFYCNQVQIQSYDSSHCGLFAVLFVLLFDWRKKRGRSRLPRVKFSRKRLARNDNLCVLYIKKLASLYMK